MSEPGLAGSGMAIPWASIHLQAIFGDFPVAAFLAKYSFIRSTAACRSEITNKGRY
jgi:hypothetical protein